MDADIDPVGVVIAVLLAATMGVVLLAVALAAGAIGLVGYGMFVGARRLLYGTVEERELGRIHRKRDKALRDIQKLGSRAELSSRLLDPGDGRSR